MYIPSTNPKKSPQARRRIKNPNRIYGNIDPEGNRITRRLAKKDALLEPMRAKKRRVRLSKLSSSRDRHERQVAKIKR